jgi:23S rRNA pseudouridine1911/1915/1917 synthase
VLLVRLGWAPSRRTAKELIKHGRVLVNGRHVGKGAMITTGDDIRMSGPAPVPLLQPNSHLKIETLYEDENVLVVNKPGLIPCHPLRRGELDTVINAVAFAYPEAAKTRDKPLEGGLVHRLDNGTSGALIIARTPESFTTMRMAVRRGDISRRYLALCAGDVEKAVQIVTPISHHPKNRRKMVTLALQTATPAARSAATLVRPLQRLSGCSLIEARPRTGRRHQVRVHLASIGHPLVGDALYGGPAEVELSPGRFWLHLSEVAFESPSSGYVTIQAPLPADLDAVLRRVSLTQRRFKTPPAKK